MNYSDHPFNKKSKQLWNTQHNSVKWSQMETSHLLEVQLKNTRLDTKDPMLI